jgi:hypothetical protein
LPGVFIDVSQAFPESQTGSHSLSHIFRERLMTDAAGRYQFTMPKSRRFDIIYFYYRVRYQTYCPIAVQLFLIYKPVQAKASSMSFPPMKRVPHTPLPTSLSMLVESGLIQEAGSVLLRGPVDVVLPVSPPGLNARHGDQGVSNSAGITRPRLKAVSNGDLAIVQFAGRHCYALAGLGPGFVNPGRAM